MKKTFKDYKPQLYKLELTDPFSNEDVYKDGILVDIKYTKIGAWLMLVSANDIKYRQELWRIERIKANMDPDVLEKKLDDYMFVVEEQARIMSTRVVDWDEDFFGCKCSREAVKELFMDENSSWIAEQVNRANGNETNFFCKPKKPKKVSRRVNKTKPAKS